MDASASHFSAVDSSLGYLYQVRAALLWALLRLKAESDFLVSIETLDDVTFETTGHQPTDVFQTKHHLNRSASLTDACTDLWKTLRIWCEGTTAGIIANHVCLCLVTTGSVSPNSAASFLRATQRDIAAAKRALDATAASSTNKANADAYAAYLSAGRAIPDLLNRITVIDNAPTISDLDGELKREVFWAVEKEHHAPFLERLEGWWLRRVLNQLVNSSTDRIASAEIEAKMADLRGQFKQDSLPIDDDLLEFVLDDGTHSLYLDFPFVHQLDLIKVGKRRVAAAIRDYYRAFEQRSRWLRDDLIGSMDLVVYEKRLVEEWEIIFEAMRDELGEAAADEAQCEAARSVLAWAERASFPIRPSVTEPFLTRGSFHLLADEIRIGWHPEFQDRLASLLGKGDAA
jgi:hypothetical protein